jgi:hypothetical protein
VKTMIAPPTRVLCRHADSIQLETEVAPTAERMQFQHYFQAHEKAAAVHSHAVYEVGSGISDGTFLVARPK